MLKTYLTLALAFATYMALSQPTIDGSGADTQYTTKATWTQADTGFGDYGMSALRTYEDGTYLYVMITGSCETNSNDFYLFINSWNNTVGRSAGNALPNGNDGASPFSSFNATLDFQVDYGLRLTSNTSEAYVSIINYTSGGSTDTFLATIANNGTATTISAGSFGAVRLAYNHTASLSGAGNSGWEMRIPLAAIGSVTGDSFEFLAMYGNGDYISANTLPEIAGQSGTNLGSDPNFSSIGGNQHSFFSRATLQPIIDGMDNGDIQYLEKATWTEGDTGFGDYGMVALKAREDGYYLYILVEGVVENKSSEFNEFYLFINSSSETNGLPAGNQLPAGNDGSSPFIDAQPTLDFEVDYGLRLTVGNSQGYTSIIDYTSGGNTDTYLTALGIDGTPVHIYTGAYAGTQVAYMHAGNLTSQTNQGWEMRIPLSAIGAAAEDDFQLFGMYGNDENISQNTLPEIGEISINLGSNPDFVAIGEDQFTATSTLPVELVSFDVRLLGANVEISWSTASELNNDYFIIQRSEDGARFQSLVQIAGAGTTSNQQQYQWTDMLPFVGTSYYRLVQVDYDGTTTNYKMKAVHVKTMDALKLWPNPVGDKLNIMFGIDVSGDQTIQIIQMNGQVLLRQPSNSDRIQTLRVQALEPGIYFLQVIDTTGTTGTRFIKH